ncbi:MAG: ATP-binding protein [Rhodospirillaceae bacterium]|nr:ATP-binding protein [Rhodospirillaceae bacterium]
MGADLSLRLEATREELPRMQAALEAFAREEGWPSRLEFQIKLVIEEVVMNILSHGYEEGGDHDILIELASDGEKIGIEIVDDGRPYDPLTEAPAPDTEAPLADRPVGGLGVYLVCALMDEASYRREDNLNRLALTKQKPA